MAKKGIVCCDAGPGENVNRVSIRKKAWYKGCLL